MTVARCCAPSRSRGWSWVSGCWRHGVSAGEPLPADTLDAVRHAFDVTLLDGIGMSECMVYCHNFLGMPIRPGSCGRPSPGADIAVMDEQLRPVAPGETGVLCVRRASHPGMMKSYWNKPEHDADVFRGEWYYSGDMVAVDADGYFWFKGRADDVIKASGYRISPFEVEACLAAHPAVHEAAVVASPDELRGAVVKAFVVLRAGHTPGDALVRDLQEHVKQNAAPYKYPRRVAFVDALPKTLSMRTGRIHTSYHQTGAVTGRLSSSEPNLQNIPVRTEQGREIRRAFVPRTGDELLIVADYSQIELRILAHFCHDEALIQAFRDDLDIHAFVAAQINGVELADVTREMRSRAKAVNFGIIYGQTAFGLARTTGMSQSDARAFIDDYFARYPRIREFIDQCVATAKEKGSVTTLLGRRRAITGLNSRNHNERSLAERLAVNTVIQGSAADMIKTAMVQLHRRIRDERLPLRMLLQVHDELVCESPKQSADEHAELIERTMAEAIPLCVPVTVDAKIADNWLDAK